jgi:LDH2 family malate/lactate/ureidoglycolate dehydrogenase
MMSIAPIAAERLNQFVVEVTRKAGLPEEQACILADTLVEADLKGIRTHGLLRLPIYVKRMETGAVNVKKEMTVVKETKAVRQLDARNGLGQVACFRGMGLALTKAEEFGLGTCGVFNSNHCGALGYYTDLAAEKKMIGFMTTNVFPLMAPVGGKEKAVGNNPFAISVPRREGPPITYDVATSTVSFGKVLTYLRRGEKIPLGWVLDGRGLPTDNPEELISRRGSMTPFAGHKGYGLAFVLEILAGVLTGAAFGRGLHSLYDADHLAGLGQFLLAVNIECFMEPEVFFQSLEDWIGEVKFSPLAEGSQEILIPGELERKNKMENLRTGLIYDDALLKEFDLLAEKYALAPLR